MTYGRITLSELLPLGLNRRIWIKTLSSPVTPAIKLRPASCTLTLTASFRLLADTDKLVVEAYGVWGEKKFMGKTYMGLIRTTFLINENGIIENLIEKVDTKNHAEQIMNIKKITK